MGCCVGRPLDISLVLWLPWVYPAFYRQAPLVEGFLVVGMAFLLWFGSLYEPSGVGDCKGPYALTGPLPACTCGTQYWDATQYTHNHACSRTVHVLHTRVVTLGENNVGYSW